MRSPYERRKRRRLSWAHLLLLGILIGAGFVIWQGTIRHPQESAVLPPTPTDPASEVTPTMPQLLSRQDVLPTPTLNVDAPQRTLIFPGALLSAPIIEAVRASGTWETRYLGDSVGHLQGTAWFDDPGGNIVLAAHVETALGARGPFAHLYEVEVGDEIILREEEREQYYRVTAIEQAAPTDIYYAIQDGIPRLTLITCNNWDQAAQTYLNRLIVIAEPVTVGS